ncbi:hypothetical protein BST36_12540 [Mycolicibacterium moriokaense]|jgi:NitT/TauT family transport system substrate-binding protein|uniref:Taurine ABC transporter substrate-binding protein n=1 Tax=Mycolicibacterium moriokaense TaxID=39691 RepID=A0AAD1HAL8_9MYCO|nr:ABC transporter substrate-binding protein [Mycolicibacterium moriokaense]MCV7042642.1 ABC transporter substrate-binding protein [Mycolicibacterium moriokaense]ORB23445.1 hypothetical protein BST36_12540 [Mycolicibacterium moriokaense]BBX01191.1 taurine ABC transporter substrate-binding protein [Mycolicibacterium moriokaense]
MTVESRLRTAAALVLSIVLGVTVTACGGSKPTPGELTVAWVVDPCWAQVPVAEDLGFFADAGVTVKVVPFPTGAAALEALAGGAVDVANGGDVPTSAAALKNQRLRIIADGARWDGGRFVVRKSSDITTIPDLAGRRIAVPLGSSAHYFATKFLTQAGVQAELIQTGPGEIPGAIGNRDVDAVAVFQPALAKAVEALNGDSLELQGSPKYNQHSLYLANENTIAAKKPELAKFLSAVAEADAPLTDRTPEAMAAVAKATALDETLVDNVLREFVFKVELGPELAADLADRARWAQGLGRIPADAQIPDYQTRIDASVLGSNEQ